MPTETTVEERTTKRVVLRQERVIVLPADVTPEQEAQAVEAVKSMAKLKGTRADTLWSVIGEFDGATKDDAIEAYAGKAGTDSAKVGTYKAPGARAWAGGARYVAPPKPLVEKEAID